MKKFLLFIAGLLSLSALTAQEELSTHFLRGTWQAAYSNPALLPRDKFIVKLPDVYDNIYISSVTYDDLIGEDEQGKFNLNNLRRPDGTTNEDAVAQLERILAMLEIEPTWAAAIADWIDPDAEPGFPDGAEDSVYTSLTPPHRAANLTITRVSELLVLNGFGPERYAKLAPHVTALPVGTALNVCTASGEVLDSLKENDREFSVNAEDLAKRRTERCFPDLNDVQGWIADPAIWAQMQNSLTESSKWFRANVWVTIGTTQFTLYSLLQREGQGPVRTILRSFGSD